MTTSEFKAWLDGFMEGMKGKQLTASDAKRISEQAGKVHDQVVKWYPTYSYQPHVPYQPHWWYTNTGVGSLSASSGTTVNSKQNGVATTLTTTQ